MKTKYITLTVALLFSLYVPAQAQSDEGSIWDGIEGTLTKMFNNPIQGTEAGRLLMLFNSDISMIMKAHNEMNQVDMTFLGYLSYWDTPSDASMYAEFDWDNKALSMHFKKSENDENIYWNMPVIGTGADKKTNKAIDQYQYTDKNGYWYVPIESKTDSTSVQTYVKFNAKKALMGLAKVELDSLTSELLSEINKLDVAILQYMFPAYLIYLEVPGLIDKSVKGAIHDAESYKKEIPNILNEKYLSIVGFPVFIHWAFLYSPNFIRARFDVTETKLNCHNIPNGCTKLTVASGKEKGKFMIFDQYNRLIYIDSKKDGSVKFFYGRDLTVKLPAAQKMSDVIKNNAIENK